MRQTMAIKRGRFLALAGLCAAFLALAPVARAERALLSEEAVTIKKSPAEGGVPGENVEGACGVAIDDTTVYLSDYYTHIVDVFKDKFFDSQIEGDPLDGPCQLATGPSGTLYANNWHQGVERLLPTPASFDTNESTGVAVDQGTGNVYVVDRTYVAVYDPAGTQLQAIGAGGALGDAYGIAVFGGKVYVPDAADDTVKVFEPTVDLINPVAVIDGAATPQGGFNSLVDAAVAVDPASGHVLVLDNLQPAFEHPLAVIDEFDSAGTFLGQLAKKVIDGEPSGLAFDAASNLYATSGNEEGATLFKYGPYSAAPLPLIQPLAAADPPAASQASPGNSSAGASVAQVKLSRPQVAGAAATLTATLTGPGSISVSGSGLRPLIARASGAGERTLILRLNRQGRRALARTKLGRLKVRAEVSFMPAGGDPVRAQRVVSFKRANGAGR